MRLRIADRVANIVNGRGQRLDARSGVAGSASGPKLCAKRSVAVASENKPRGIAHRAASASDASDVD